MWQRLAAYSMIYRSGSRDAGGSKARSSARRAGIALGEKVGASLQLCLSGTNLFWSNT